MISFVRRLYALTLLRCSLNDPQISANFLGKSSIDTTHYFLTFMNRRILAYNDIHVVRTLQKQISRNKHVDPRLLRLLYLRQRHSTESGDRRTHPKDNTVQEDGRRSGDEA